MNTYTIRLPKLIFFGYHGCYEVEKTRGQQFEVDIEINFKDKGVNPHFSDFLGHTIDYIEIQELIKEYMEDSRSADLLETLVYQISEIPYKWIKTKQSAKWQELNGIFPVKILSVKAKIRKKDSSFIEGPFVEVEYIRDSYDK